MIALSEDWALNKVGGEVTLCRTCFGQAATRGSETHNMRKQAKPSAGLEPATPSLPWRCSTN